MIFGFGGAFMTGFLGTAWPRFVEGKALRKWEVVWLVLTWLASQWLYFSHQLQAGDTAFAAHIASLMLVLACRLGRGRSIPPPGFAVAFCALALGFVVTFAWAAGNLTVWPVWIHQLLRLLAWQGVLLLPILGVGSYLFARFFQLPDQRPPNAPPRRRALGVWLATLLVLFSLGIEAYGFVRTGNLLRLVAITFWAVLAVPALIRGRAPSTRAWALRIAISSLAAAFAIRAVWLESWPPPLYAAEHILFIAGFGLTILLIADRVTLGHCADLSAVKPKSRAWRWIVWLVLLAALTRVSADMKLSLLVSHHVYAALMWAGVIGVWAAGHLQHWRAKPKDDHCD